MDEPDFSMKYKAQVYDVALNAFFKLRAFDSEACRRPIVEVGWHIAEALVAAAVSGVTYKSADRRRWFDAAQMLRQFADMIEEDGLRSLPWSYSGKLDARQAWRPDIRAPEGRAELEARALATIEAYYRPFRALTMPDRQASICMAFARTALEQLVLCYRDAEDKDAVRDLVQETVNALLVEIGAGGAADVEIAGESTPSTGAAMETSRVRRWHLGLRLSARCGASYRPIVRSKNDAIVSNASSVSGQSTHDQKACSRPS